MKKQSEKYKITFNWKCRFSYDDIKFIKYLLHKLYKTNENFNVLMKEYDTICIVKNLHYDNENIIQTLHFNAYLYNNTENKRTRIYHFYLQNNAVYRITEMIDII